MAGIAFAKTPDKVIKKNVFNETFLIVIAAGISITTQAESMRQAPKISLGKYSNDFFIKIKAEPQIKTNKSTNSNIIASLLFLFTTYIQRFRLK